MIQDSIKLIGQEQNPRKDSLFFSISEVNGLISTFEMILMYGLILINGKILFSKGGFLKELWRYIGERK